MMWTKRTDSREHLLREYDQEMLRAAFVSLFWSIIVWKKKRGKFDLKTLAEKLGKNKSEPSRWFSGRRPNWTINTIADIASTLDVDLTIQARDRITGTIFMPSGPVEQPRVEGAFWPWLLDITSNNTYMVSNNTYMVSNITSGVGDDKSPSPTLTRIMAEVQ